MDTVAGNLRFWNMHKGAWNKQHRWKKRKETDEPLGMEQVRRHGTHKGMEQAKDGTSAEGWNKQGMEQTQCDGTSAE